MNDTWIRHALNWSLWWHDETVVQLVLSRYVYKDPISLNKSNRLCAFVHQVIEKLLCNFATAQYAHLGRERFLIIDSKLDADKLVVRVNFHTFALLSHDTRTFVSVDRFSHKRLFIDSGQNRHSCQVDVFVTRSKQVFKYFLIWQSTKNRVKVHKFINIFWYFYARNFLAYCTC